MSFLKIHTRERASGRPPRAKGAAASLRRFYTTVLKHELLGDSNVFRCDRAWFGTAFRVASQQVQPLIHYRALSLGFSAIIDALRCVQIAARPVS